MKGFADVPHTGEEIRKTTLKELHEKCGIGSSPEDVVNRVHGSILDEGSNILLGWKVSREQVAFATGLIGVCNIILSMKM